MNDNELIIGLKTLDQMTLSYVYDSFYNDVCVLLERKGCDKSTVKDIFQDALIALINNIQTNKFESKASIKTYLTSIAKYKWYNHDKMKKNLSEDFIPPDLTTVNESEFDHFDNEQIEKLVSTHFEKLDEKCQMLLNKNIFQNIKLKEIAVELGYTYEFVRIKKRRCLNNLKSHLLNESIIVRKYG